MTIQFGKGSGGILKIGSSGGSGDSGGPAPAIDGYHKYVWACDDAQGSTSLVNSGGVSGGDAAITGTTYLQSSRIGRGTKSAYMLANNVGDGAYADVAVMPVGGMSIEAFFVVDCLRAGTTPTVLCLQNGGLLPNHLDYFSIGMTTASGQLAFYTNIRRGTDAETYITAPTPPIVGSPVHLLATHDPGSRKLSLYVNGALRASTTCNGPMNTLVTASIGNLSYYRQCPLQGSVMQARVTEFARDATYALNTAQTLFAML